MSSARTFLFLQGPPGPFFQQLGRGLASRGHRVTRIHLNGGDWLDWANRGECFAGTQASFAAFLEAHFHRNAVTDLVLFGDCRPMHRIALRLAQASGIAVHVFEEGYIRPDWVTLERDGVNGYSPLPRRPSEFLALAADLPPLPHYPPIPARFFTRAREATRYYFGMWALAPLFPGYRTHRPFPASVELLGWLHRSMVRPLARLRSLRAAGMLEAGAYFVLPLQLDSDHQIRTHSPFADMAEAALQVLASFAAHAPEHSRLVIKEHPLDNGLRPWRKIVRRAARRHGVEDRVTFLEQSPIDTLVVRSRGVVTVNSTTGTLALAAGIPVTVLGHAVYDVPGITHQDGLDRFWSAPVAPQIEIYDAFRRVLAARCLLRGGFSTVAGRANLVPAAVERLCSTPARTDAAPAPLGVQVHA